MSKTCIKCVMLLLVYSQLDQGVRALPEMEVQRVQKVWLQNYEYEVEFNVDWTAEIFQEETRTLGDFQNISYIVHEFGYREEITRGVESLRGRPYDEKDTMDNLLAETLNVTKIKLKRNGERRVVVAFSYDEDLLQEYLKDPSYVDRVNRTDSIVISEFTAHVIPEWVSILPVAVIIIYALFTQEVLVALMLGVYSAAFIGFQYNPWTAFLRLIDTFIIGVFESIDHVYVILFAWFLAGMVACMRKAGGATGLARSIASFAASRRLALVCTWILGLLIFFDEYANCLVVGSTMRPVTDAFLVSREKLAFVIDATAAPVTSIVPVSSWIGFELSVIEDSIEEIYRLAEDQNIEGMYNTGPFLLFINSIPARFYPIAMIALVIVSIVTNYDMGPLLWAERRAVEEHKVVSDFAVLEETNDDDILEEDYDTPTRWWNSVLPVLTVTVGTVLGIIFTGLEYLEDCNSEVQECRSKTVANVIGHGDPFRSLLWGAAGGSLMIWTLSAIQHKTRSGQLRLGALGYGFSRQPTTPIVGFYRSLHIWLEGTKGMMGATMVLIMAWAMSDAIRFVGTDRFIASGLSGNVDQRALPAITFLVSAAMGFATGTSWGTMTIMFPIATLTAFKADPTNESLMIKCIGSILSGAVWGDHCSFISDTTILSSIGARCDVRHHVLTQLPYAMLVGIVSTLIGDLCVGYGLYANYVGLIITCIIVIVLFFLLGAPLFSRRYDLLTFIMGGIIFWRPCQTCYDEVQNDEEDDDISNFQGGNRVIDNEVPHTEEQRKAAKRVMVQRMMMDGTFAGNNMLSRRGTNSRNQLQGVAP